MKRTIAALLIGGFVLASLSAAPIARAAGVLTLSSSAIADNGTLAIKNACADKQRSPNCVGENLSPPLAWENVPEGTKSFALIMVDPEGRAPAGVNHMVIYGIPADIKGFEGQLRTLLPLGFDFSLNVGYTDGTFNEASNIIGFPAGMQIPDTPKWEGSAILQWKHALANDRSLFGSLEDDYVGTRISEPVGVVDRKTYL